MREIQANQITDTVARLAVEANHYLGEDVVAALKKARFEIEESPQGKDVLDQLLKNVDIAKEGTFPLCQDTGVAVVSVELGQDVQKLQDLVLREWVLQLLPVLPDLAVMTSIPYLAPLFITLK